VKTHDVLANVNKVIAKARMKNIPIIFVRVGFSSYYREWPESSVLFGAAKKFGALQLGTWATEIHASINKKMMTSLLQNIV
jgi:nicotinamidase-related amidase